MNPTDFLALLPPSWQPYLIGVLTVVALAAHFTALTGTPAPNTPWGAAYRIIELVGGKGGLGKEIGVPIRTQADLIADLQKIVLGALNAGTPIDPQALAGAISGVGADKTAGAAATQTGGGIGSAVTAVFIALALAGSLALSACSPQQLQTAENVGAGVIQGVDTACAAYAPIAAGLVNHNSGDVKSLLTFGWSVCDVATGAVIPGVAIDSGTASWIGTITGALGVLGAAAPPVGKQANAGRVLIAEFPKN